MDTPMLLSTRNAARSAADGPGRRAHRPLILTPWQRFLNAIAWLGAACCAPFVLAWYHLTSMSRCDWLDLPGHLIGFTLRAALGVWMLAILTTAALVLLAIPVGILSMLGTLVWRGLGV